MADLVQCNLDTLEIGDVIYLSTKEDAVPFTVLDKGTPFILIENMKSHFANLYRVVSPIYKKL